MAYLCKVEICGVDTSKLPILNSEQMLVLFRQYQNGDKDAREQLIYGNLRLVLSVIQRFSNRNENADDLFQVGCIGLMKAIDNFDLKFEVRFSTYAVPKIAGEIRRFLRDDGIVKVSRSMKEQASRINTMRNKLIALLGREPTIRELSDQTGITTEEIAMIENAMSSVESIHQTTSEDGFSLESVLTDTESEERMLEKIALRQAITKLQEREKTVIDLRYYHGLTQERTAKIMSVSQVQVSRIEKKAIQRLRELIR